MEKKMADNTAKQLPQTKLNKKSNIGLGQIILTTCLVLYTLFCFLPLLLVVIIAFTDEKTLASNGFSFFPQKWSMNGMNAILRYGNKLFKAYGVTISVTVLGTALGLIVMALFAYGLSRKDFKMRKFLSIYLLIPMLFSGGQVASYIIFSSVYHLKDTFIILILPICISTMNVIILRTYIQSSIPEELMESAKIDGASEQRVFWQIVFPLMKPAMAAVGFMLATQYWNDWQTALLFINKKADLTPLQLLLINIQKSIEFLLTSKDIPSAAKAAMGGTIPNESAIMSTVIIVIGPIIIAYPFFQKYFVKGLTVGSVKG